MDELDSERPDDGIDVDVIVVAHGPEPIIAECVGSILDAVGVRTRVILVDNGCTNPDLERITGQHRVVLIGHSRNDGFAGGVRRGLAEASAPLIAIVNSDVTVPPRVLRHLAGVLEDQSIGLVSPRVLRRQDGRINSDGNPLHVLGYSWAGRNGEIAEPSSRRDVAVASGAMLMARRSDLERLDVPHPNFFLYHEDTDVSLAFHQQDMRVVVESVVTVAHEYVWDRNTEKLELAERNRLVILLTRYPRSLLVRLSIVLVAVEIGSIILGGLPGARRAKLRGHLWLLRNLAWILARRRANLSRAIHMDGFVHHLTAAFDASAPEAGLGPRLLDLALPAYLRAVGVGDIIREPTRGRAS